MSDSLKVEQIQKGDRSLINISGRISEDADFSNTSFKNLKVVIFDFNKVVAINSMGIQKWIAFLKQVPKTIKIAFRNCPLRIINQINLFPAFLGDRPVQILSFYAPYYCEECDESFSKFLSVKEFFPAGKEIEVPEFNCTSCGEEAEFGAVEEKYFLFLKRIRG